MISTVQHVNSRLLGYENNTRIGLKKKLDKRFEKFFYMPNHDLIKLLDNPFRFFMAIGALSGLVSMAFHSFFDFNLQIPANCVYFVMLLGIVDVTLWQDTIKTHYPFQP
ncbi:MAG: hypothetical protein JSW04_03830 [Desulfobacterales bacterium]|nr:MAG: hypothetical protein JSW04_03830 [Desulfobacterales bacterium]